MVMAESGGCPAGALSSGASHNEKGADFVSLGCLECLGTKPYASFQGPRHLSASRFSRFRRCEPDWCGAKMVLRARLRQNLRVLSFCEGPSASSASFDCLPVW